MEKQPKGKKIIIAANILSVLAIISIIVLHNLTEKTTVQQEPAAIANMPISEIAIEEFEIPTIRKKPIESMMLDGEIEEIVVGSEEEVDDETIEVDEVVVENDDQTEYNTYEESQSTWSPNTTPSNSSRKTNDESSETRTKNRNKTDSQSGGVDANADAVDKVDEKESEETTKEEVVEEVAPEVNGDQSCEEGSSDTDCEEDEEVPVDKDTCEESKESGACGDEPKPDPGNTKADANKKGESK